jgi:hypothetical protein
LVNVSRSLALPAIAAIAAFIAVTVDAAAALPERVTFASADGRTTLVGYVFLPEVPHPARTPAVVMMHGRAGAYSSAAKGKYDASTLSKRHQQWASGPSRAISPSWSTVLVRAAIRTVFPASATIPGPTS